MTLSRQEEIIATLWIIAALLAFGNGYTIWGYIFAIKGAYDTGCSIVCALQEIITDRKSL